MRLTERVHQELRQLVHPGDTCIDATAGNGHDTLALAKLVGPSGRVIGIDIQSQAVEATRLRLSDQNCLAQCELIQGDHAIELGKLISGIQGQVKTITFNLGYLPAGDTRITTQPSTTLSSMDASARLLEQGGALFVTAYRGHEGGNDEAEQVESWMLGREENGWSVESHEPPTRDPERVPPILWIARKPA